MGNENADYFLVSPDAATREAVAGATDGLGSIGGGVARRAGTAGDDLCRMVRAREVVGSLTPAGNKVYEFLHIPGAFRRLRVAEHARVVTKALVDAGKDVFVVTTALPASWPDKADWLREHFPHLSERNFVTTAHKGMLKLDVLVDDGAHYFCGFEGYGIVFDEPWNQHFHGLPNLPMIRRAKGWLDVARVLKVGLPLVPLGADAAAGAA